MISEYTVDVPGGDLAKLLFELMRTNNVSIALSIEGLSENSELEWFHIRPLSFDTGVSGDQMYTCQTIEYPFSRVVNITIPRSGVPKLKINNQPIS